jgi:hypothetical protein
MNDFIVVAGDDEPVLDFANLKTGYLRVRNT